MRHHCRFAIRSDGAELALLRWHSRSAAERTLESVDAFTARFTAWLATAIRSGSWHAAVADEHGALVGCMYLHEVETVPVPGIASRPWGYVTHAYVTEGARNRGIGQQLLSLLIGRARELGLHELQVWPSVGAISLYVRAGFLSPEAQRTGTHSDEPSYLLRLTQEPA